MTSIQINIAQSVKRFLRIFIAYLLYYTGLLNLLLKIRLKNKAVVLMYHRVLEKEEIASSYSQAGIIVSKESFATQIKYLKKNFHIISLNKAIEILKNKTPFPSKSCIITFDDGWKDNYINAYPILKKNDVSAAIFLPTEFIEGKKRFWQERMVQCIFCLQRECKFDRQLYREAKLVLQQYGMTELISKNNRNNNEEIIVQISRLKNHSKLKHELLFRDLSNLLGNRLPTGDQSDFLDWTQITRMAANGIEFGSHGKSHSILSEPCVQVQEELRGSKKVIEEQVGKPVSAVAYPNGNYNQEIIDQARQCGYCLGFGTDTGLVDSEDNPYTLRRINIHEDMTNSIPMFLTLIAGLR